MPIVRSHRKGERGKKDAKRHRQKQKEAIRKKLPDIVSEESIITRKKGKKVKVPIRGIVIPDFRPGTRNKDRKSKGGKAGIGQGSGSQGDVIKKGEKQGSKGGKKNGGKNPGEDYIESEIDIEEIIEMIHEDLGLPNLEDKEKADMEVILGFKLKGTTRDGPQALEFSEKISQNALGRFWAYMEILQSETGRSDIECFDALQETGGILGESMELLKDPDFLSTSEDIEPFPIIDEEDMRYHDLRENVTHQSNAVVFIEIDVSFSMSKEKKYLARSMMFWMVEFLRKMYDNVDVRFVIYHGEAKIVSEYDAFHTASTGGTRAHKGHEIIIDQIQSKYPTSSWNVYVFQFSDGDDWDSGLAIEDMKYMFDELDINMFGYSEVLDKDETSSTGSLFNSFKKSFDVDFLGEEDSEESPEMLIGKTSKEPLVATVVKDKDHIWPTIKEFLKKERSYHE